MSRLPRASSTPAMPEAAIAHHVRKKSARSTSMSLQKLLVLEACDTSLQIRLVMSSLREKAPHATALQQLSESISGFRTATAYYSEYEQRAPRKRRSGTVAYSSNKGYNATRSGR